MCQSKNEGGIGFKDLHTFDLALLAKQGWQIIQSPATLAAKLLKAKYFPHGSFMHACPGKRPSYLWRSILEGQKVLECGVRYRVGSGANIKFWDDP